MKYRMLGSTGIGVSEIAFGAGAQGGVVFRPDRATRLEAVRRALAAGINWIDTAPSYGDGQSEENLGWILPELGASPHVSTKVRIEPEHLGDIPSEVERSLEASLKRLRLESVDLVQLHTRVTQTRGAMGASITPDDVLGDGGVLTGFERLRDRGLVRFFGFTGIGDTASLHRLVAGGRFHAVQAYYNLLNPSAGRTVPPRFSAHDYGDLIGAASAKGVGVLAIRVLAAGAIAGRDPGRPSSGLSPGSSPAADLERGARVREILAGEPGTAAQAAIGYALANVGVSSVLVGFSEPRHVDEAVAAVDMGPLSPEAVAALDGLYASDFGAA